MALLAAAPGAHASFLQGEALDSLANGIAFGGQGDRRLYLTNDSIIRTINPSTGALEDTSTFTGVATTGLIDASSCSSPNTIKAQVTFPDGRAVAASIVTSLTGA